MELFPIGFFVPVEGPVISGHQGVYPVDGTTFAGAISHGVFVPRNSLGIKISKWYYILYIFRKVKRQSVSKWVSIKAGAKKADQPGWLIHCYSLKPFQMSKNPTSPMTTLPDQEKLLEMASRWLPPVQIPKRIRVHTDTTDFCRVEYGDVVMLRERPYLIRHNAKELRFGLDDEPKFWVKHAIDLEDGSKKIIKLVFYEKFLSKVGGIQFECFRSPKKEARILDLVKGRKNFMQGYSVKDEKKNIVRILDFIEGHPVSSYIQGLAMDHETYFYEYFPGILLHFLECVEAIRFLHEQGEKHGDIRRDHILIDRHTNDYRWIDFDYNYRHRENIYGYDLFGLGNILAFLVGKGDVLLPDLKRAEHPAVSRLREEDLNIVFNNRVVNLRKVYPYLPESLNQILMHFSVGAKWFYDHSSQLLDDLSDFRDLSGRNKQKREEFHA